MEDTKLQPEQIEELFTQKVLDLTKDGEYVFFRTMLLSQLEGDQTSLPITTQQSIEMFDMLYIGFLLQKERKAHIVFDTEGNISITGFNPETYDHFINNYESAYSSYVEKGLFLTNGGDTNGG